MRLEVVLEARRAVVGMRAGRGRTRETSACAWWQGEKGVGVNGLVGGMVSPTWGSTPGRSDPMRTLVERPEAKGVVEVKRLLFHRHHAGGRVWVV